MHLTSYYNITLKILCWNLLMVGAGDEVCQRCSKTALSNNAEDCKRLVVNLFLCYDI